MVKLVDRYIGRAACLGIFGVWGVMIVLYFMVDLLDQLRATQNDYGTLDALWSVFLTIPRMAYQVFPVAALLGALVGVGGLAAANELVAFRTSGISRLRLALAALAGSLLLTIPVMLMGEFVAPVSEQQARAFRLSEKVGTAIIGGTRGVWVRDDALFVNIQRPILTADRGNQSVDFNDVVIYTFSDEAELASVTRAGSASHDGVRWTLEDVTEVEFSAEGAAVKHVVRRDWMTDIKPELLDSAVTRPKLLSLRSLWDYIGYLGENGLDDTVYQSALWEKIMFPFSALALVLAGMPFVFGEARSHNIGVRLFFGMTLGGLYIIVSRTVQKSGEAFDLAPALTMSAPVLVLVVLAILALRRSV